MRFPLIALIAGLAFAAAPAQAQQCAPLQRAISLDLMPGPGGGRFGVPITVNGQPKRFALSTGEFVSRLSPRVVAELKLSTRSGGRMLNARGNARNAQIVIADLQIGQVKADGQEMFVMPNAGGAFDGLFGPNLMQNYDIEFDFPGRKLNYFLTDHCEGRVVYWSTTGSTSVPFNGWDDNSNPRRFTIPVLLDGHEIRAEIDTFSPDTIVDADTASSLFQIKADSPGAVPLGALDSSHPMFGWTFKELKIGALSLTNQRLRVMPDLVGTKDQDTLRADSRVLRHTDNFQPSMRLGMDVLKQLHLYLAAKEGKLYLTAAPPN
jgi:hypothetical protein